MAAASDLHQSGFWRSGPNGSRVHRRRTHAHPEAPRHPWGCWSHRGRSRCGDEVGIRWASLVAARKGSRTARGASDRLVSLASVAKQANKAALDVGRYEVKPDGTIVVVTGQPEHAEPENAWPLDEFRTKETKQ